MPTTPTTAEGQRILREVCRLLETVPSDDRYSDYCHALLTLVTSSLEATQNPA